MPAGPAGTGEPDRIELRGLRLSGICGVLAEERERAQPLEIDLDVLADLGAAGARDDLDATVDYAAVLDAAERVVTGGRPFLLEHLAEEIAAAVLDLARVDAVTVAVRKLRPPVPQQLASSGVRISRRLPVGPSR